MGSDAQDVHRPGLYLRHEQDMHAPRQHGIHVQEVAGKNARRPGGQELTPRRRRPARRGAQPSGGQDPANGPLPHLVPETEQLTLTPAIPPARVLPRQLLRQRAHLVRNRRPSRRVRAGPSLLDQAPVPGQQSSRCPDPVQPHVAPAAASPRLPARHGQPSPASGARPAGARTATSCRGSRISASLSGVIPRQEYQPAEHPGHDEVDQADEHECRA